MGGRTKIMWEILVAWLIVGSFRAMLLTRAAWHADFDLNEDANFKVSIIKSYTWPFVLMTLVMIGLWQLSIKIGLGWRANYRMIIPFALFVGLITLIGGAALYDNIRTMDRKALRCKSALSSAPNRADSINAVEWVPPGNWGNDKCSVVLGINEDSVFAIHKAKK